MQEISQHNAGAWLGATATLLRFEELVAALADLESPEAEKYFGSLLAACGIDGLLETQRRLVDFAAPGLRRMLGYA